VIGVLDDKDAGGIVDALAPVASHVFATAPGSDRASDADRVADLAEARGLTVTTHSDVADAAEAARAWAAASDRRAVVVAGSVILAGEALALATAENWKAGWDE
jgi:dihydrofolate synthase / folylpolyglutamate synthase